MPRDPMKLPDHQRAPAGLKTDEDSGAIVPSDETKGLEVVGYRVSFPNLERQSYSVRPYFAHDWYRAVKTAAIRTGGAFVLDDPDQQYVTAQFRTAVAANRFVQMLVREHHVTLGRISSEPVTEALPKQAARSVPMVRFDPTQYRDVKRSSLDGIVLATQLDGLPDDIAPGDEVVVEGENGQQHGVVVQVAGDLAEVQGVEGDDAMVRQYPLDHVHKVAVMEASLADLDPALLSNGNQLFLGDHEVFLHKVHGRRGQVTVMTDRGPLPVSTAELLAHVKVAVLSPRVVKDWLDDVDGGEEGSGVRY